MTCIICGQAEHRDADQMVERCDQQRILRFDTTYLRDLGTPLRDYETAY